MDPSLDQHPTSDCGGCFPFFRRRPHSSSHAMTLVPPAAQMTFKEHPKAEGLEGTELARLMRLQREFTALNGSAAMAHSTLQVMSVGGGGAQVCG